MDIRKWLCSKLCEDTHKKAKSTMDYNLFKVANVHINNADEIPKIFYPIFGVFVIGFIVWYVFFIIASTDTSARVNTINYLAPIFALVLYYFIFLFCLILKIQKFVRYYLVDCITNSIISLITKSKNIIFDILLFLISPNRLLATKNKKNISEENKNTLNTNHNSIKDNSPKGKYYIRLNFIDLSISILLFISIPFIISHFCPVLIDQNCLVISNIWLLILFYLIIYRTISRSFEIIIAFGKDCFETRFVGEIVPQHCQILAMSSLVENIFNYALVYAILRVKDFHCPWQSFVLSLKTNFFQEMLLNTEVSYPNQASLLMILQFMTSFTLIIFSIAMYASGNKTVKK